jgi:hypothetical protein
MPRRDLLEAMREARMADVVEYNFDDLAQMEMDGLKIKH